MAYELLQNTRKRSGNIELIFVNEIEVIISKFRDESCYIAAS